MQRRFDADPAFRATELLLQERVPARAADLPARGRGLGAAWRAGATPSTQPARLHHAEHARARGAPALQRPLPRHGHQRRRRLQPLARPRGHALARGPDPRLLGHVLLPARRRDAASFWSAGAPADARSRRPATRRSSRRGAPSSAAATASIETHVEIGVSPEDDVELRRVSLTNRGRTRAHHRADQLRRGRAGARRPPTRRTRPSATCSCRPSSSASSRRILVHAPAALGRRAAAVDVPPDDGARHDGRRDVLRDRPRAQFLGRGRSVRRSRWRCTEPRSSDSAGAVLDPIVAIRSAVVLEPDETARIHVVTGVAETREGALALVEKYRDRHVGRPRLRARLDPQPGRAAAARRHARPTPSSTSGWPARPVRQPGAARAARASSRATAAASPGSGPTASPATCRSCWCASRDLAQPRPRAPARQGARLLAAQGRWPSIWSSGTRTPPATGRCCRTRSSRSSARSPTRAWLDSPGGIFVRRSEQMSEEDQRPDADRGARDRQRHATARSPSRSSAAAAPSCRPPSARATASAAVPRSPAADVGPSPRRATRPDRVQRARRLHPRTAASTSSPRRRDRRTPAPWVNVLANPWFGTRRQRERRRLHLVRERPQLPPDAVEQRPGQRRERRGVLPARRGDGRFWSPTPLPAGADRGRTRRRHGFGYSVFEHAARTGIASELTHLRRDRRAGEVPRRSSSRNRSGRARRLSRHRLLRAGARRDRGRQPAARRHRARSEDRRRCSRATPTTASSPRASPSSTAARSARTRQRRSRRVPRAQRQPRAPGVHAPRAAVGAGRRRARSVRRDAGAASSSPTAQEREIVFTFGSGRDRRATRARCVRRASAARRRRARRSRRSGRYWNRTLGAVHVRDARRRRSNFLANGWLLYQVLAVAHVGAQRLLPVGRRLRLPRPAPGRDGAGARRAGAPARAAAARGRRASSARATCSTGGTRRAGRGVRTRISDDYLWLPYATCRYVDAHRRHRRARREGRRSSTGRPVKPDEDSYYDLPGALATRRDALRALRARDPQRPALRRARPAADGQRRLERRHEPGRRARAGRERVARRSSCTTCSRSFAALARATR